MTFLPHLPNLKGVKPTGNSATPLSSQEFRQFMARLEMKPLLAHHPSCHYYNHHLIWIGKLPLCLGCSMMTCGMVSGLLWLPHLELLTTQPFYVLLALGIFLYIPALLQIWIQVKAYKVLARYLLGVSVTVLIYAGLWMTPFTVWGWILKIGFVIGFILVWNLTLKVRSHYSKSPCQNCPEGRFPLCSYTMKRIPPLANRYFAQADGTDPEADEFVRALQGLRASHRISGEGRSHFLRP